MLREAIGTEEELRLSELGVMLSDGSEMSVSTTGWETDNASRTSCGVGPPHSDFLGYCKSPIFSEHQIIAFLILARL